MQLPGKHGFIPWFLFTFHWQAYGIHIYMQLFYQKINPSLFDKCDINPALLLTRRQLTLRVVYLQLYTLRRMCSTSVTT